MKEPKFPKGPWVWGHPQAGPEHESDNYWESALYAPDANPKQRFILEAHSIGDGIEDEAESIKRLIAAAPDLYEVVYWLTAIAEEGKLEKFPAWVRLLLQEKGNAALEKVNGHPDNKRGG